jgi:hypothetical protein
MVLNFSVQEALPILKPLLYFVIAMVAYCVFVFKFYRFMARKNIFELNLYQYSKAEHAGPKKFFEVVFYVLEYIILFPIFTLVWVVILSALLFFMSENADLSIIILGAVALVTTVRIAAYFSENLSQDVAKLLPFGLLAFVLTKISEFQISSYKLLLEQLPGLWKVGLYYLIFIIIIEFTFRILYSANLIYSEAKQ